MLVLQQAVKLTENTNLNKSAVRFAAICHDLGKALTPKEMWPSHMVMKKRGIKPTRSLCKRLRVPNYLQELAELTCEYHTHVHKALELRPENSGETLLIRLMFGVNLSASKNSISMFI